MKLLKELQIQIDSSQIYHICEGGKATEKLGTTRASAEDIKVALDFVSRITGIDSKILSSQVLGSSRLTALNKQKDSGDVDLALDPNLIDMDDIVKKMTTEVGSKPYIIGGNTFSFAVPVNNNRKVQVDLMFMPDIEWAKFSHYSSEHSKHKSGVRNELLHSALKFTSTPGEDLRVKDEQGRDIVRASRSYKLDTGVERIFKITPERKDGNGRVKGSIKASPKDVQKTLDAIGNTEKFNSNADIITSPDKFAEMLFGKKIKGKHLMSAEQLITLINRRSDADDIFKDAVHGIKARGFEVPKELQKYEE
jgi:hypothetical protein